MDYRDQKVVGCLDTACGTCSVTRDTRCDSAVEVSDMTVACLLKCICKKLIPIIVASYFIIVTGVIALIYFLIRFFAVLG